MKRFIVRMTPVDGIRQDWIEDQLTGVRHTIEGTGQHRTTYSTTDWYRVVQWLNERQKLIDAPVSKA